MSKTRTVGLLAGLALLVPAAAASAAPVTVNLRVEGPTKTDFEGPVTTDVIPFKFSDSTDTYECDDDAGQVTTGAVLTAASEATPFGLFGTFNTQYGAPTFTGVGDEMFPANGSKYLAEYLNGRPAQTGSCTDPVATGDTVLFAYAGYDADYDPDHPLAVSAPPTATPGQAITVKVTDAESGAPVTGATISGQTTGADGTATVTPTQRGLQTLKATKDAYVRSNVVPTCVTDGADGYCGTTAPDGSTGKDGAAPAPAACVTTGLDGLCGSADKTGAFAKVLSVREGQRFAAGRGPRTLSGTVDPDPSGIKDIRLRLSRTSRGRCFRYDGRAQRFVATKRCGVVHAQTFSVGRDASWSYLLPSALPAGRYVLDVVAYDPANNRAPVYERGRNRVVFTVG